MARAYQSGQTRLEAVDALTETFKLSEKEMKAVSELSKDHGVSISETVRAAVQDYIKAQYEED